MRRRWQSSPQWESLNVHETLLALVRRDMIRPDRPVFSGERAYRFRHLLIRDAAYESIPKEARATLHERHARLLDARFGDRAIELDEIVGYHYEQAFQYRAELGSIDDETRDLGALQQSGWEPQVAAHSCEATSQPE